MTAETVILPPTAPTPHLCLPLPGSYTAPPERCIVELTARIGPLVTLRCRFTSADATLTVDQDTDRCSLRIDVRADSLRAGRPHRSGLRGRRGLHAGRHPLMRFESERIEQLEPTRMDVQGHWQIRGVPQQACLSTRVSQCADDRLIFLAVSNLACRTVRRSSGLRLPRLVPARRLRLLVAADFS